MKKILFLFVSVVALISCDKEDGNDPAAGLDQISANAILKYSGTFNPTSGINVAGNVKIYLDGSVYKLKLEDFTVSTGPDLKVYLSTADTPANFVNLGPLGTESNLMYAVTTPVDFSQHKYVLIHCQQYNHLFATSSLMTVN